MTGDIINPTVDNPIKSIIRLPYEILQVMTKGFPVYYTRKGTGYSVDNSDNEIECIQDQPLFEYVDNKYRYLQYEGTSKPVEVISTNVNHGTLSVLTEDINTRAFAFDGASFVNADLLISELIESIEFKCRLSSAGGKCLTMCPGDTDSAVVAVDSGGGFVLNFTHNGTDYVSTTELSFNTDYRIKIDISGNLYVDDVIQTLAAGSNYVYSSTDILFGYNGLSNYLTGYMWDLRVNNASGILAHYAHPGDRRDDVAPDSSGNGLHGKIVSDDVMSVRVENAGFGYPVNEKAPRPWSKDGTTYGVKGLLNGVDPASGSLHLEKHRVAELGHTVITNGDFSDGLTGWAAGAGWSVVGEQLVCDGTVGGTTVISQNDIVTPGKWYVGGYSVNCIAGKYRLYIGTEGLGILHETESGTYRELIKSVGSPHVQLKGATNFEGTVDDIDVREVQVILATEDGTPLVYIDPFDGYVKMTDGTNTAVSPSVVTPGVEYSAECVLSGTTMRIDKDGVTGTPSAFTGHMPDLGDRVFLLDSRVYQTCREIYFVEDGDLI